MATRRQAHCAQRRGTHHARRTGGILRQESKTGSDSAKAQQSAKARKARTA